MAHGEDWMQRCCLRVGLLLGVAAFAGVAQTAAAGAYKCTTPDGSVAYQQVPCPKGSKEQVPRTSAGPTLTEEEKFNAAAYQAGLSPDEARALLAGDRDDAPRAPPANAFTSPSPLADELPPSVPSDPKERAFRCTKPNGTVYFSRSGCGATRVRAPASDWQSGPSTIVDHRGVPIPGAVRTGPGTGLDPFTGQVFPVVDTTPRPSKRVNDGSEVVDRKEACASARHQANERRKNPNLSFDDRRKLDDAVYDLCTAGRRFGD